MAKKYQQLFSLFGICHFKYSGTDPMKDEEINVLGKTKIKIIKY